MYIDTANLILDRHLQKATMHTQDRHILDRLEQRLRRAIDLQDTQLIAQLQSEQKFIQSRQL